MFCVNCTSPIPAERQARKSLTTAVTCSDDCRKAFNQERHAGNKYKVNASQRAFLRRLERAGITIADWAAIKAAAPQWVKARKQANGTHSEAANGFATEAIEGV